MSQCAIGNISFTMDVWSDGNLWSYLALTAHWISEDPSTKSLHLESTLLGFYPVCERHTGETLTKVVLFLLDRLGITTKVYHFSLCIALHWQAPFRSATSLQTMQAIMICAWDPSQCTSFVMFFFYRHWWTALESIAIGSGTFESQQYVLLSLAVCS